MSRTSTFKFAAIAVTALAVMLAIVAVAARPAQAYPNKTSVCSGCHSGAVTGSVTAAPSNASPAPGAAYTVDINIGLGTSGSTGYHIADSNAGAAETSWTSVYAGGPGSAQTKWTANMTAPVTPGTYYYKVWGVKGPADNTGSASYALYSITVGGGSSDTTPPVTTATGATNGGWYKAAVNVTLTATDATGVDHIAYTLDGTPGTISGASGSVLVSGDGPHTLQYQAVDTAAAANTEAQKSISFSIDSTKPVAAVLANATVKKGAKATIKYQVTDTPNPGTATTTIKIKNAAGKVVKTLKVKSAVGTPQTAKFTCKLAKGVYKVTAQTKDLAGNVSKVSGAKKLTVK